jgi:hypothetical protein
MPAVYFHEDFIDVECVAVASVPSLHSSGVDSSKFDTPEADRFSVDSDASFGEQIFDVAVTEVESIIESGGVGDDVGWKPVALVSIHRLILAVYLPVPLRHIRSLSEVSTVGGQDQPLEGHH